MLLNDQEKAKISYESAVRLQPRNAPAQCGLAVACAKLGMDETELAPNSEECRRFLEPLQATK